MRKLWRSYLLLVALAQVAAAQAGVKEVASFPSDKVFQSLISRDGALIAAGTKENLVLWDRASGKKVRAIPVSKVGINAIDFSHHGGKLALAYDDGNIKVEDARTGAAIASSHASDAAGAISFSPDDGKIGIGTEHGYGIWTITQPNVQMLGKSDFGGVFDVRFSPDGSILACSAGDANVYIVDTNTMKLRKKITDLQLPTYSMAFPANGKQLFLAGGSGKAAVINARDWTIEREYPALPGITERVAISDDGKHLGMLQADQRNFDTPLIVTVSDLSGPQPKELMKEKRVPGMSIVFSPSGEFLFTRWSDGALHLYSYQP